jgi:uncharacterized protein (DUF1684 family)
MIICGHLAIGQDLAEEEINAFRAELNRDFANPESSPLEEEDREKFEALEFFPIDLEYRIKARFVRTPDQQPFEMITTTDRRPVYEKYGECHFEIEGRAFVLEVYQSHRLREKDGYENYLFLPFKDHTNGSASYGGGRYIDLRIPEGETIIIDFNQSYNPYCAYNYRYSCPLVPEVNHLEVPIPAGVKNWDY